MKNGILNQRMATASMQQAQHPLFDTRQEERPLKILFANCPADGHFNPLTGMAAHLRAIGHDVRWYTSRIFEEKISRLGIPFYPTEKAFSYDARDLDASFPQRKHFKNPIVKLNYDLEHLFILRGTEYYEDIKDINQEFPFDVLIAEVSFTAIPFVRHLLRKPVISVGIFPLIESSRDLAPYGLAITPSASFLGRKKQDLLRLLADQVFFRKPNQLFRSLLKAHGICSTKFNMADLLIEHSSVLLQNGTPGFEYNRSDINEKVQFAGPLVPVVKNKSMKASVLEKINKYARLILVTQGTVENNPEKILVPTMEAFKDSGYLVVATTGGANTEELRDRYPQQNILIEDFISFNEIMPYADVYVTNGGFGGVLQGISHKLPMVVAGVHEGKNEINARVGYFRLGINLKTETPTAQQIRQGVEKVLADNTYKQNVQRLSREFSLYNPNELCEQWVYRVVADNKTENSAPNLFSKTMMSGVH